MTPVHGQTDGNVKIELESVGFAIYLNLVKYFNMDVYKGAYETSPLHVDVEYVFFARFFSMYYFLCILIPSGSIHLVYQQFVV